MACSVSCAEAAIGARGCLGSFIPKASDHASTGDFCGGRYQDLPWAGERRFGFASRLADGDAAVTCLTLSDAAAARRHAGSVFRGAAAVRLFDVAAALPRDPARFGEVSEGPVGSASCPPAPRTAAPPMAAMPASTAARPMAFAAVICCRARSAKGQADMGLRLIVVVLLGSAHLPASAGERATVLSCFAEYLFAN